MQRTPALVEIHYALWGVLSVPFGFAGVFFIIGLMFVEAMVLVALSALFVFYVSRLSQGARLAWALGAIAHAAIALAAFYYIPRWPAGLAVPLLLLNLYSLGVLLLYRNRWAAASPGARVEARPV